MGTGVCAQSRSGAGKMVKGFYFWGEGLGGEQPWASSLAVLAASAKDNPKRTGPGGRLLLRAPPSTQDGLGPHPQDSPPSSCTL